MISNPTGCVWTEKKLATHEDTNPENQYKSAGKTRRSTCLFLIENVDGDVRALAPKPTYNSPS